VSARPLGVWLVENGYCADEKEAAALVMAGEALLNDRPAKAGDRVGAKDKVRLRRPPLPYAAKGGLKLEGALARFGVSVQGRVCLDAGASTGGFTDCLLRHGAQRVYAVDVGYGQLRGSLRQDGRVVNLERTNIASPALLKLEPVPSLGCCDLSYLSLRKAIPLYREILRGRGEVVALVKPLFEVDDAQARRSGNLPPDAYEPMLAGLTGYLNALEGVRVRGVCESPVTGNAGTVEFFLHVGLGGSGAPVPLENEIARSVEEALKTQPYRKQAQTG